MSDKYAAAAAHHQVIRRLAARTETLDSGCVVWTGSRSREGYGTLMIGKMKVYTHRLAYTLFIGPIPEGMVIDHLCRNRACLNTDHLRVVTMKENSSRTLVAERTHCPSGHEYSPENTRLWTDKRGRTHRYCIACKQTRNAMRGATRRETEFP